MVAISSQLTRRPDRTTARARALVEEMLALPREVRRATLHGLTGRDLALLLGTAHLMHGTPYVLYRDDPVGFVEDVLGETLWAKQKEVLEALATARRVAVPAGFGLGKTHLSARAVAHFVCTRPVGAAVAVTTATRMRQVQRQLWPHIRRLHARANLPGEVDTVQWKMPDSNGVGTVVAYGFTAPPGDEAAMQGIHCFDSETELLTDQGWKPFPRVTGAERVLTLNGDVAEWGPITEVIAAPYDGEMNLYDPPGGRVNFCITDNHQLLVRAMHYGKTALVQCRYCEVPTGAKGIHNHTRKHLAAGDEPVRERVERIGNPEKNYRLAPYSDLPAEFFVRRTNTWRGTNPDTVVFGQPEIEVVCCALCRERIPDPSPGERTRARGGRPVFHRACRAAACRAHVTCSRCGSGFTVPASQARRAKRLYCPGGSCRAGSHPGNDPVSAVTVAQLHPSIDAAADRRYRRFQFAFSDWAQFLGWYVSEGSTSARGGSWRISLAQKPGTKYDEIASLLTRMGIRFSRERSGLVFSSLTIGHWLLKNCGRGSASKRIPLSVREARPEIIRLFLDAYRKGDGSRHTHAESARYFTSSKQLADDLHEVLAKLGSARKMRVIHEAGSVARFGLHTDSERTGPVYVITEAGRPADSNVKKKDVRRVPYRGTVHCVTTPHHTIMVRRKGCPMWSGNSGGVLLVVDEAGGIDRLIGGSTNNLLTGDARMLAIGNPPSDDEGSWFEQLCGDGEDPAHPGTVTIRIPATASPAITGEPAGWCTDHPDMPPHSLAEHLPSQQWVDDTVRTFGADSPYVVAKVHARFPRGGSARVMPMDWLEAAAEAPDPEPGGQWARLDGLGLAAERAPHTVARGAWIRLGVDVAAGGGDEMVIARCIGDLITVERITSGAGNASAVDVAGRVLEEIRRAEALRAALGTVAPIRVKVDSIGVGWGVTSTLAAWASEQIHSAEVVGVNVAENTGRTVDGVAMVPYRKRDEMWLAGRALVQPAPGTGAPGVRLRVDDKTLAQLSWPTYATTSDGRTKVESKKLMRARGLSSPDRAEAVLLAVYETRTKRKARLVV